jgi:hypothetical protein
MPYKRAATQDRPAPADRVRALVAPMRDPAWRAWLRALLTRGERAQGGERPAAREGGAA